MMWSPLNISGTPYLSSISRDGAGHNSLQITAETDTFYRDDRLLSQYCPEKEKKKSHGQKLPSPGDKETQHSTVPFETVNLLLWILGVWFIC